MVRFSRKTLGLALALTTSLTAAFGQLPEVVSSDAVTLGDIGIYCKPRIAGRADAPGTAVGYVNLFAEPPVVRFHQRRVPATLGISFGIQFTPQSDFSAVRLETWKPGASEPEVWYGDWTADFVSSRGFSFDFKEELILGTWRLEAWDADRMLYSVSFEVVPPEEEPKVINFCEPAIA